MVQVLPIKKDDVIAAMLPVSDFLKDKFLVLCTEKGVVKKTPLSAFADVRSSGIAAIKLRVGTLTACCCFVGSIDGSPVMERLILRTCVLCRKEISCCGWAPAPAGAA